MGDGVRRAYIDAATVVGIKASAPTGHNVLVTVRDEDGKIERVLSQDGFRKNPRHVFNLYLTDGIRNTLQALAGKPTLGELFEIHEGIHSGNIRDELFVASKVDKSCRELIFGRDEIRPYLLHWNGKYVRLSALPAKRTRRRYANLGRAEWYEQEKILVRRTGDYILAAAMSKPLCEQQFLSHSAQVEEQPAIGCRRRYPK